MTKTFIIAEAGSNHNRNLQQALKLIDIASDSGADVCKFQTYSAEKLFSTKSKLVNGYDVLNMFNEIQIPRDFHPILKEYCDEKGVEFMSTPFDEDAVDELFKLGVKRFKIAGFESTDLRFIKYVASTKLPLIISAGIGTDIEFIEQILNSCYSVGANDVTILHCNNGYPTLPEESNLETILKIKETYGVKVGFSDHTTDTITPALAVALGASVIEKHFTISKLLHGPDHKFALNPEELTQMVKNIRHAEKCMGSKDKTTQSELDNIQGQRSIVAIRDIEEGEVLSSKNTTTKRPFYAGNVHAKEYYNVIDSGYKSNVKIHKDDFVTWKSISR